MLLNAADEKRLRNSKQASAVTNDGADPAKRDSRLTEISRDELGTLEK